MTYLRRALDDRLDRMVHEQPAIAIEGPKAVGKTMSALRRATSVLTLDDPAEVTLLAADRSRLRHLPTPVLIDEWQKYPPVWDMVRRAVDGGAPPGSFLLTGSATPHGASTHSGAGRIVRLRMRPMSLAERGLVPPAVSVAELMTGARPPLEGASPLTLADYADEIVASGFPGIRTRSPAARRDALDGYLEAVVEHDFAELGHIVRRPESLRAWLTAFAAATSTTASYNSLLDAATAGQSDKPAKTTTIAYRDTLARMWVLDELPAWTGSRNRLLSLSQTPKHHLADPALAARILGADARALVATPRPGSSGPREGTLLGALFESLVTLCVRVHADAAGGRVSHLRTPRGDHEIDLVVTRDDGAVLALEVKLAPTVDDHDVAHLRWLRDRLGDELLDAVVVTTGPGAYRRDDGIAVVPAALLGP